VHSDPSRNTSLLLSLEYPFKWVRLCAIFELHFDGERPRGPFLVVRSFVAEHPRRLLVNSMPWVSLGAQDQLRVIEPRHVLAHLHVVDDPRQRHPLPGQPAAHAGKFFINLFVMRTAYRYPGRDRDKLLGLRGHVPR